MRTEARHSTSARRTAIKSWLVRCASTPPPLAPAHFVRRVEVSYEGKPVMFAGGQLPAKVVGNQDLKFNTALKLDAGRVADAPAPR